MNTHYKLSREISYAKYKNVQVCVSNRMLRVFRQERRQAQTTDEVQ